MVQTKKKEKKSEIPPVKSSAEKTTHFSSVIPGSLILE